MQQRSYEVTDRFQIRAEDGSDYEAIETTTFLHCHSHSGSSTVRGMKELRTAEGYHINFDGAGGYTIVDLALRATRVEPV